MAILYFMTAVIIIMSQKCYYRLPWSSKYMFRNLNHVSKGSESAVITESIYSAQFGGHLGFMQIRRSSTP